jgi:hypothetical protein
MPFNGSGVFVRNYNWVQDASNGIDIDATRMDADTNDITGTSGLSLCVTRDGQGQMAANFNPATTAIYDIGTSLLYWRNAYLYTIQTKTGLGNLSAALSVGATTYSLLAATPQVIINTNNGPYLVYVRDNTASVAGLFLYDNFTVGLQTIYSNLANVSVAATGTTMTATSAVGTSSVSVSIVARLG